MLPKWHVFLGILFSIFLGVFFPSIDLFYLTIVFFSSFLIDFDHYVCAVMKTKHMSLRRAFAYHQDQRIKMIQEYEKGIRKKGDFHLFHTLEFHALIGILGIFWAFFFYVFIGMIFHSLLDLVYLISKDLLYRREFSLIIYLLKRL